jgi:hypothetical protein
MSLDNKDNKRHNARKHGPEAIDFSIIGYTNQKDFIPTEGIEGKITDISETGLGLLTDFPLEAGNLLRFNFKSLTKTGVVMWSMKLNGSFKAGIKFV